MAKSLVIVESPSKAKTIGQYLGEDYEVFATVGHIKNLPGKKIGVDIENGFRPEYVTIDGKKKIIDRLKKLSRDKDSIFIATDPDREGEAIAWHIAQEVKNKKKLIKRVLFNEITKEAVVDGIKNPIDIDENLVQAQQARRVMDRLVGYKVSPFLWKTLSSGLSAGRVQSVALKLISEREEAVNAFVAEEYWTITAQLKDEKETIFDSELLKIKGKKAKISDEKSVNTHQKSIKNDKFVVSNINKKRVNRKPAPPFITSTLQQDASRRFGMSTANIMRIAQQLYEGIEISKGEQVGLITYMRTDSTRIADKAISDIRTFIYDFYGKDYLPPKHRIYKRGKGKKIQDAHECIRPTSFNYSPDKIRKHLSKEQFRIYELIWNRFVACQMSDAQIDQTQIDITCGDYLFRTTVSINHFLGFLQVYEEVNNGEDESPERKKVPQLTEGMVLELKKIISKQHFTKPPARFTESMLVKELESNGIGRPSTYAIIISNIVQRKYVEKKEKKLFPTELGLTVNKVLAGYFSDVFNVKFTSEMEEKLDKIESGEKDSVKVLSEFYKPFEEYLKSVNSRRAEIKQELVERTDEKCDLCGSEMVIKWGRYGKFFACSGYPECKNIKPLNHKKTESVDEKCPKCDSQLVKKEGRFGEFLACSNYPECKFTKPVDGNEPQETDEKCPKCESPLVIRMGPYGKFLACSNYPKCRYIGNMKTGIKCQKEGCDGDLVERFSRKAKKKFYGCSKYPDCDFVSWYPVKDIKCPHCGNKYVEVRYSKDKGEYDYCPICKKGIEGEE